jgi:hypothetical protein
VVAALKGEYNDRESIVSQEAVQVQQFELQLPAVEEDSKEQSFTMG